MQQFSSTTIVAKKTVAEVQTLLSSHGATAVMVAYDRGDPVAMKFTIVIDDEELGSRMPIDWEAMRREMWHDRLTRRGHTCPTPRAVPEQLYGIHRNFP
jgi:hypothetical protein